MTRQTKYNTIVDSATIVLQATNISHTRGEVAWEQQTPKRIFVPPKIFDSCCWFSLQQNVPQHVTSAGNRKILLGPLAGQFYTPTLKMVAQPVIATVSWVRLPVVIAPHP